MADVIRLKLNRKEIPVVLDDENGLEKKYTLKELSGAERNQYLNKMKNRVSVGKDGKTITIKNFDGMQADLLSVCLFDDENKAVAVEEIEEMPSSTQNALFEEAQKLSGLDIKQQDEEKNV